MGIPLKVICTDGTVYYFATAELVRIYVMKSRSPAGITQYLDYYVGFIDRRGAIGSFGDGFTLEQANAFAEEVAVQAGLHEIGNTYFVPDAREHLGS